MLSPSTSSFLEDESFWGFPAGNVKGGEGWERLTRPFWVNFIVATSLPFWPRFTLEAALGPLWSFIALGNEVGSPPPRQQAACGHAVVPAVEQSGFLCSPWNQSVQAMRESLPQLVARPSPVPRSVCVHACTGAVQCTCPSQQPGPAVRAAPGCVWLAWALALSQVRGQVACWSLPCPVFTPGG